MPAAVLDDPRLGIGGNNPPVRLRLADEYEEILASIDMLETRAADAQEPADDRSLGAMSDLSKDFAACLKRVEAARVAEKEPFLAGGREVDAFFKPLAERAEKTNRRLLALTGAFLRRKAEEERRRREAEEKARREEAARLMREAEERDRKAKEAAAEAARLKEAEDRDAHAAAEATRLTHEVQADLALENAAQAERDANAAARAVAAKPAEHARTRGDSSLATLAVSWNFEIIDISAIPLEQLRPYIPRADLEKAVRAHIRIHKDKPIAGVSIFEETKARIV